MPMDIGALDEKGKGKMKGRGDVIPLQQRGPTKGRLLELAGSAEG